MQQTTGAGRGWNAVRVVQRQLLMQDDDRRHTARHREEQCRGGFDVMSAGANPQCANGLIHRCEASPLSTHQRPDVAGLPYQPHLDNRSSRPALGHGTREHSRRGVGKSGLPSSRPRGPHQLRIDRRSPAPAPGGTRPCDCAPVTTRTHDRPARSATDSGTPWPPRREIMLAFRTGSRTNAAITAVGKALISQA